MEQEEIRRAIEPTTGAFATADVIKHAQKHRTIRTTVVACSAVAGLAIVCVTALRFSESLQKPAWVQFALGLIAGGGAVSGVTMVVVRTFHLYVRRRNGRVEELEAIIDARRTSSGLNKDGTHDDAL